MNDIEYTKRSLQLYHEYCDKQLFYNGYLTYNKLVTADPFYINKEEHNTLLANGDYLWKWLSESRQLFKDIYSQSELSWLKELLHETLDEKTMQYQQLVDQVAHKTSLLRADLSSFPFGCHEAQLRWGVVGHMHFITDIFDKVVDIDPGKFTINKCIAYSIQTLVNKFVKNDNEICIFMTTGKYIYEMHSMEEVLKNIAVILVSDFNENNFSIKNNSLIHKASGKVVKLVFRRETTLSSLLRTEFGEKVVKLSLDSEVAFEPDLNLINDSKLTMALAFDPRTSDYFSDESRNLFLKTSLFDDHLLSFNQVFNKDFKNIYNLIKKTTPNDRKLIYKYGGFDIDKSFGGGQVYRLDRAAGVTARLLQDTQEDARNRNMWILQQMDQTRYQVRYLRGNYDNPESCAIDTADNCAARFMMIYSYFEGKSELVSGVANFVNDYWKARFKTSNTKEGKGAIVTGIRVKNQTSIIASAT